MIDIHCHILPGLDDGAQTREDSLAMAREAIKEGISEIIATPHHQHPSFQNDGSSVRKAVDALNNDLEAAGIELIIRPGQELRLYGEMTQGLASGSGLALADSKYVLIEFPSSEVPAYAARLLYEIGSEGYIPVIAHPERNKVFKEDPDKLYELVKNGALTQLTSSSVTGYFGKDIATFSRELVEANLVHVLASDAHNLVNRTFRMQEAFHVLEEHYGQDLVYSYQENARLIAEDKHVYLEPPERVVKKRKKWLGLF
ncbi:tyrosine-protein phosphatase [Shouchella clausii]|uniref:Tyrosine-protein phosphatase n=1 Tax=Shouchella clausii TaxID=79880 RepID=A0A268S3A7_SHOCL|nr:CpsB/CapC family capsule biosynthesis tyrosine phosphatase [Shouchella clausii]PAD44166.1 tyrosine protein phosphatase [Bacillus sp. 7520-S]SPU17816.1 capsular polysaccharide biosynthesis protein [Niallia circulans]AST95936.1 tyrosine protein phosphatase [Shouchella clausii]MBU8595703.1 tyrosine protein phosphatase [Shouchella clausii]MCR1287047.1 tyrosine protein phosphatase [Shouchella clausii]